MGTWPPTGRLATILLAAGLACAPGTTTLPPTPQLVVWIDTDMPVPQYVDTLRIEQLDDNGNVVGTREQTLPDPSDWPASFGVTGAGVAHLRARAFAGHYAVGGDPPAALTIDRLVDASPPADGIAHVVVLLSGDCWGSAAKVDAGRTCVAQGGGVPADPAGSPGDGLEPLDAPPSTSAVGTWAGAMTVPCTGTPRADSGVRDDDACIPGGASFLGFDPLAAAGGSAMVAHAKLMRLSPFFLDVHEVTLARWNAAIARGFAPPGAPIPSHCAPGPGTSSLAPVVCVTWDQSEAFCSFDGGRSLPSEAQWHHAASGRGQERPYPWGWDPPTCDDAVWGENQSLTVSPLARCTQEGGAFVAYPSEVGSRPRDTTIDGVADMAGNVQEFALDYFEFFDRGCWSFVPLPRDFVCTAPDPPGADLHSDRGGSWGVTPEKLATTFRDEITVDMQQGFRCARPDSH
jgi:formylglycine-generating enzyme required for sulfatase activity